MPSPVQLDSAVLGLSRTGLHAFRHAVTAPPADPAAFLQETGFAAGEEVYGLFLRWLPTVAGVNDPAELDASVVGDVLSEFFQSIGWGGVKIEQLGAAGLTIDSTDW